jgi:hypothetical protein
MDQKSWTEVLARGKLLLGIGRPIVSPSREFSVTSGTAPR